MFSGSREGARPEYAAGAGALGRELTGRGIKHFNLLTFANTPAELLDLFAGWRPPTARRVWLEATET